MERQHSEVCLSEGPFCFQPISGLTTPLRSLHADAPTRPDPSSGLIHALEQVSPEVLRNTPRSCPHRPRPRTSSNPGSSSSTSPHPSPCAVPWRLGDEPTRLAKGCHWKTPYTDELLIFARTSVNNYSREGRRRWRLSTQQVLKHSLMAMPERLQNYSTHTLWGI